MIEFQTEEDRLLLAVVAELLDRAELSPERLLVECGSDPYRAANKVIESLFPREYVRRVNKNAEALITEQPVPYPDLLCDCLDPKGW